MVVSLVSGADASPPGGTNIATDDAGASGHVQLFKLAYSAAGVITLVPVDANGLKVNTGLPAAAAMANGAANPTTPAVAAFLAGFNGTTWDRIISTRTDIDAVGNNSAGTLEVSNDSHLYNGATWDRQRNNTEGTLLASAARSAGVVSALQTNYNGRGVIVFLNVTAASGTGGLSLYIRAIDPISGNPVYLNPSVTPIVATGLYAYELCPGAATAGTAGAAQVQQRTQGQLPRRWGTEMFAGDGSSYTYSVGYAIIL